jgi:outer membrane lipoprotein-sorting protein
MKSLVSGLVACSFALVLAAASPEQTGASPDVATQISQPAATDLLRRMIAINAKLKTYKADVHLEIALKSFPYISPSLEGNLYYKQPNKRAVVFDTVPMLANQVKKVYPKLDEPIDWPKIYEVTPISDESGSTTFRLIPKKNGRVEHLDVKVDDATATIRAYTWTYKDGGYVTFDQSFKTIEGNYLAERISGRVELPSYKAEVTSTLGNYKLNVSINDSVFEDK